MLLRVCAALINPSRFEGWNTSVMNEWLGVEKLGSVIAK